MAIAHRSPIIGRIVVFEAGLGVLAVALAWVLGISLVDQLRVTPKTVALGSAATVPMAALMALLASSPWPPSRELLVRVRDLVTPLFRDCSVLQLGIIALAAGVGEELLFRGVMQVGATAVVGVPVAIALTSVIFGVAHALTPLYAILAIFVSAYLGWLMVATGSLVPPIVAHAMYDWMALIYLVRYDRKRVEAAPPATSERSQRDDE